MAKSKFILGAALCLVAATSFFGCNNKAEKAAKKAAEEAEKAAQAVLDQAAKLQEEMTAKFGPFGTIDFTFVEAEPAIAAVENFSVGSMDADTAEDALDALYDVADDALDAKYDVIFDAIDAVYDASEDSDEIDALYDLSSDTLEENYGVALDRLDAAYDKQYDIICDMD